MTSDPKMQLNWESEGVLDHFRHLQKTSGHTDITFHCSDGRVSAHQMVLARVSGFLSSFMIRRFITQDLISMDMDISLPDVQKGQMEAVIELIYTGKVNITQQNYKPFRCICKLLDIALPLEDYDAFFSQMDPSLTPNFPETNDSKPQLFACDVCSRRYPLKIALQRHQRKEHAISRPVPPLKAIPKPKLDSPLGGTIRKNSAFPGIGENSVQCPDCGVAVRPSRTREHLAKHLRRQLSIFVADVDKSNGPKKCILCSYQSPQASCVSRHAGMSHNKIVEFANEAQLAFLKEGANVGKRVGMTPPVNLSRWNGQPSHQDEFVVVHPSFETDLIGCSPIRSNVLE